MKFPRRQEPVPDEYADDPLEEDPLDDYDYDVNDDFLGDVGRNPMDKHKDLLKDLTNFEPYIKDSVNNWLGLRWDEQKGEYVRDALIKATLSIQGGAWCVGVMKTYTRGNNIITDIGEEEYKNIMADHIENVWLNLGTRDDLGIKNDGDLIRVANEMEHAAALALMGAGDGKYNKFLGTTYSQHATNPQQLNQNPLQNPMVVPQQRGALQKIKDKLLGRR